MRDQVAHHLERARMRRVHHYRHHYRGRARDRGVARTWRKSIATAALPSRSRPTRRRSFAASGQDLEEMAGNLVDNACKWAASQVFVEVLVERPVAPGAGPMLRIIVDDDGAGCRGRAGAGLPPRPAAGRVQARFGWVVDRGRSRGLVRRQPDPRQCADRGAAAELVLPGCERRLGGPGGELDERTRISPFHYSNDFNRFGRKKCLRRSGFLRR